MYNYDWKSYNVNGGSTRDRNKQVEKLNKDIFAAFKAYLLETGLKPVTLDTHLRDADIFLNIFLRSSENVGDCRTVKEASKQVELYLGTWLPKIWKCSPSGCKGHAAMLRKLYKFLLSQDLVTEEDCEEVKRQIKKWREGKEEE